MTDQGLPPVAIRRGDGYAVLNVDLEPLFSPQRAAVGVLVWEQVKHLMEANGESVAGPRAVDMRVGEAVGIGRSGITQMRRVHARKPKLMARVLAGELTIAEASRTVGLKTSHNRLGHSFDSNYFRRGDKFEHGVGSLQNYLQPWKEKGFKFGHVPPREARRRLPIVRQLVADLQQVIGDLEMRSHSATTSAPPEREKGEHKA